MRLRHVNKLGFGHWSAHKLEQMSAYTYTFRHGDRDCARRGVFKAEWLARPRIGGADKSGGSNDIILR